MLSTISINFVRNCESTGQFVWSYAVLLGRKKNNDCTLDLDEPATL